MLKIIFKKNSLLLIKTSKLAITNNCTLCILSNGFIYVFIKFIHVILVLELIKMNSIII